MIAPPGHVSQNPEKAWKNTKADSDSRACAELLLRYFAAGAEEKDHIRTYRFEKEG